jgi:DNA-binding NarL/FixJ family response regulator
VRLFLCDDNPQYRRLARIALERAGHEIVGEAGSGQDAIDRAPACAPDAVLLDLNMPGMNGFDALPPLRSALPHTPIVILTTGQAPADRRRALDAGADGFIVKPERLFALGDALAGALARQSPGSSAWTA